MPVFRLVADTPGQYSERLGTIRSGRSHVDKIEYLTGSFRPKADIQNYRAILGRANQPGAGGKGMAGAGFT